MEVVAEVVVDVAIENVCRGEAELAGVGAHVAAYAVLVVLVVDSVNVEVVVVVVVADSS